MNEQNTYGFLCDSEEVVAGSEGVFEVNNREVLVGRANEGELFAVENN